MNIINVPCPEVNARRKVAVISFYFVRYAGLAAHAVSNAIILWPLVQPGQKLPRRIGALIGVKILPVRKAVRSPDNRFQNDACAIASHFEFWTLRRGILVTS